MRNILILSLALLAPAASADQQKEQPKRLIVGFKADVDATTQEELLQRFGLTDLESIDGLNARIVEAAPGQFSPSAMRMMADPSIYYVEEDFYTNWLRGAAPVGFSQVPMPALDAVMSGLPKFEKQDATEGEQPWGVVRVGAEKAWQRGVDGRGVRVAVIDTGIDCAHPDLKANCQKGYNAIDSKKPPTDDNSHGTHVAGTIAAANDGQGVVGVAPAAKLYPVKVLDADGGGSLTSIIKGLVWAGNNGMQIANMSLGSSRGSVFMRLAVSYAKARGVALLCAAGNSGGSVGYPAAYDACIAVAASDSGNNVAEFSSRGKQVDFIAPGVDVKSTVPGGGYDRYSGTSMATPHAAGLAALAVQQGAAGKDGVMAALKKAAKPLDGLSGEEQGMGMPNAEFIRGK
ncbi:MAG: S8 family peptidase [Elusimicrobia bacterium]|nr:S8 family peptidase [Elusimicrobiota bacterium]